MKRSLMRLVVAVAVMVAMVLAMSMPALAFHVESHIGGNTPEDKQCHDSGGGVSCQGGGGGRTACAPETHECATSEGAGNHNTFDPTTGDYTSSGGGGGNLIGYDENGQEIQDPGGSGVHCEGNVYTGEQVCHGSPGTSA